jgi:hypothetical protein
MCLSHNTDAKWVCPAPAFASRYAVRPLMPLNPPYKSLHAHPLLPQFKKLHATNSNSSLSTLMHNIQQLQASRSST